MFLEKSSETGELIGRELRGTWGGLVLRVLTGRLFLRLGRTLVIVGRASSGCVGIGELMGLVGSLRSLSVGGSCTTQLGGQGRGLGLRLRGREGPSKGDLLRAACCFLAITLNSCCGRGSMSVSPSSSFVAGRFPMESKTLFPFAAALERASLVVRLRSSGNNVLSCSDSRRRVMVSVCTTATLSQRLALAVRASSRKCSWPMAWRRTKLKNPSFDGRNRVGRNLGDAQNPVGEPFWDVGIACQCGASPVFFC